MSCYWCIHWLPERGADGLSTKNGHCTLNPVWLGTSDSHYCGQIQYGADKYSDGRTTMVNRYANGLDKLRIEQAKLLADQKKLASEKRLVAAEKKLLKLADATKKRKPHDQR